jgi:hypothetical protein
MKWWNAGVSLICEMVQVVSRVSYDNPIQKVRSQFLITLTSLFTVPTNQWDLGSKSYGSWGRPAVLLFSIPYWHVSTSQKRFLLANDITWPLLLTSTMAGRLQENVEKYDGERSTTDWGRCGRIHLWVPFLCHSIGKSGTSGRYLSKR